MLPDLAQMMAPVDEAQPCGPDLEYDAAFIELQEAARGRPEQQVGGSIIPAEEPDYPAVTRDAAALVARSRDLRIAAILAEAALRTEGVPAFATLLGAVEGWLTEHWAHVHPMLDAEDDDDPTMRVNAMAAFTTVEGRSEGQVLRALRLAPLTQSRAFGQVTLRDILIAKGEISSAGTDGAPDLPTIGAAFEDTDASLKAELKDALAESRRRVKAIDAAFTEKLGTGGPDLSALDKMLYRMSQAVGEFAGAGDAGGQAPAADAPAGGATAAPTPAPAAQAQQGGSPGTIASSNDVVRALDRIVEYYERHEPSSPVPLLIRRARRLVNADFTTIIKDMANDGYDQVRRIGGLTDDD